MSNLYPWPLGKTINHLAVWLLFQRTFFFVDLEPKRGMFCCPWGYLIAAIAILEKKTLCLCLCLCSWRSCSAIYKLELVVSCLNLFMVTADSCPLMQGLYTVVWIFVRGCAVSPSSEGISLVTLVHGWRSHLGILLNTVILPSKYWLKVFLLNHPYSLNNSINKKKDLLFFHFGSTKLFISHVELIGFLEIIIQPPVMF